MPNDGQIPDDPQPGGREPAPDRLRHVQAFINSNYDLVHEHGAELFASPEGLARWLYERGLVSAHAQATAADLNRAIKLREGLRRLLIAKHDGEEATLDETIHVAVRLSGTTPRFEAAGGNVNEALDLILAHSATAQLDGSWARLKACRECAWAFYDHSRNSAGNWCSMKVCGGRVKQRAHYKRSRAGQP